MLINGNEFGSASAEIKLKGSTYYGLSTVNYGDKVNIVGAGGSGSVDLGPVIGEYTATFDFEMVLSESKRFEEALGSPFVASPFNAIITYVEEPGAGVNVVEITAAIVMEISTAQSRGQALVKKYTCYTRLPIRYNGRTLVNQPQQGIPLTGALSLLTT